MNNDPSSLEQNAAEFSTQRLDRLVEVAAEIEQAEPEIIGVTVFGSTARGEARPDSDADLYVFVERSSDPTSAQHNVHEGSPEILKYTKGGAYTSTYRFPHAVETYYKQQVEDKLKVAGLDSDINVCPIDKDIITDQINDVLKAAEAYEKKESEDVVSPYNIRGLFHVPISDEKLKEYQRQVIERFSNSPFGDTAWRMIRHAVVYYEKGRNGDFSGSHRSIPKTIQEAAETYL